MHDVNVRLKDGTTHVGPLWTWRPQYGWFSLVDGPPIALDDVAALTIGGERTGNGDVVQRDGLAQAVDEGWKPGESPDGNLIISKSILEKPNIFGNRMIRLSESMDRKAFHALRTPSIDEPGYFARADWGKPWEPGEECLFRGYLDGGFYACRFHGESEKELHLWIDHRVEAKPEERGAFGMR